MFPSYRQEFFQAISFGATHASSQSQLLAQGPPHVNNIKLKELLSVLETFIAPHSHHVVRHLYGDFICSMMHSGQVGSLQEKMLSERDEWKFLKNLVKNLSRVVYKFQCLHLTFLTGRLTHWPCSLSRWGFEVLLGPLDTEPRGLSQRCCGHLHISWYAVGH